MSTNAEPTTVAPGERELARVLRVLDTVRGVLGRLARRMPEPARAVPKAAKYQRR